MRTFARGELVSFSKNGLHSPIGYGSILSYDSIHEEYLIVDQYDEVHRRKSGDIRGLKKKIKLSGMNATVYRFRQGVCRGMFRAEIYQGEIVNSDVLNSRAALVALQGTPGYHAYIVLYVCMNNTLELVMDDSRVIHA